MQPSRRNFQNSHEERAHQIDDAIKTRKERLFKEFENTPEDSRKRRPKFSQSKQNKVSSGHQSTKQRPFAPFVSKTLEFEGNGSFFFEAISYDEKNNMIIACPNQTVQFYDATTFLPMKNLATEKVDSTVQMMSFCAETETFLLGCWSGNIYSYNVSNKTMSTIRKKYKNSIETLTFLNSRYFAFVTLTSSQISIGNFANSNILTFHSKGGPVIRCLENLKKKKLLLSGSLDASVRIYRTDRLPKLPVIYSIRGDQLIRCNVLMQEITINGKEYIITANDDWKIRIWHLTKGKMKLLKVISVCERILRMVYLENYKILATSSNQSYITFYQLPSGKFKETLNLNMNDAFSMFLMKDKNVLGVAGSFQNRVKIVQLHPEE